MKPKSSKTNMSVKRNFYLKITALNLTGDELEAVLVSITKTVEKVNGVFLWEGHECLNGIKFLEGETKIKP